MSVDGEELRYLAQVLEELRTREARVVALDREIGQIEFALGGSARERMVRRGDARALMAAESYHRRLRGDLDRKRRERSEAVLDVERAQERKRMIEEELPGSATEPKED